MTATIALPRRQLHSDWLARLRTIGMGLAARRGVRLGVSGWPIAPWFRANGAPLPIAAYQPLYATSATSARIDLTGNGYTLSPQHLAGPGWTGAEGWTYAGNGTQFMWAEFSLPANCSMVARFTYTYYPYGTHAFMGNFEGNNRAYLAPFWNATAGKLYGIGSSSVGALPGANSGVMGFAGPRCFYNGAHVGTCTVSNLQFTQKFCVGGRGAAGYTASTFHIGTIACVAVYASTLTDSQMIGVMNAMLAL